MIIGYYGHPGHKERTRRDLLRCKELAHIAEVPVYLAGDFDLVDETDAVDVDTGFVDIGHEMGK